MERTEWPTSEKLEKLRESGIVPFSPFASACLGAVVLVISWYFMGGTLRKLLTAWSGLADPLKPSGEVLPGIVMVFLVPAAAVLAVCTLAALLQTRFLFRPGQLAPDFGRLNPFGKSPGQSVSRKFLHLWWESLFALGAGLAAVYLLASPVIGLLNHKREYVLKFFARQADALLPVFVLVFLVFTVLGVLAAHFSFRYAHRMTREEREREARE